MTPTDWITAIAAAVSAFVGIAIWRVTTAYTRSTDRIADSNAQMARANEALIEEMRQDRNLARRRTSEEAAQRLQVALARAHRRWQTVDLRNDPDALGPIYNDWVEQLAVDRNALLTEVLRDDVQRFTTLFRVAAHDWETVLHIVENEHGELRAEQRRTGDNRRYRLDWAAERLRRALGAHQRGEDMHDHRLPKRSWEFFIRPPGEWDADYERPLSEVFPDDED